MNLKRTVYQVQSVSINSCQNVPAENFGGITIDPPDKRGAKNPARSPIEFKKLNVRKSVYLALRL